MSPRAHPPGDATVLVQTVGRAHPTGGGRVLDGRTWDEFSEVTS